eukprot:TRINITY_DN141_c0_g1_i1.p1 TRINITY_DN141_c0_g1~~TRINITY_DN141_c0_g1_i1.p1  ORF type:complete len:221 (+),score=53.80 TRINITY_DN141_c0_g1_i1:106-768(+)
MPSKQKDARTVDRHWDEYDYFLKVLLIGDSAVGKSSLLARYADNEYNPNFITTIGVDFRICSFEHKDKAVKLHTWDTSGQERFQAITSTYYRGSDGIIMVYDLTDPDSLVNIKTRWLPMIDRYAKRGVKLILVGNKCDLIDEDGTIPNTRQEIDTDLIDQLCEERNMTHIKTSAKEGLCVNGAFFSLIDTVIDSGMVHDIKKKEVIPGERIREDKCCVIM